MKQGTVRIPSFGGTNLLSVLLMCFFLIIAACTEEPTPFPADIPGETEAAIPVGESSVIRYVLAANTEGFVSELELIEASAQVEQLTEPVTPDDLGTEYDLFAAYGDLPGGTRSPVMPHVTLVIKSDIAPLDDLSLRNILIRSLSPKAVVDRLGIPGATPAELESTTSGLLRAELANAGWPDGLSLILGYAHTPGALQVAEQLQMAGIHARLSPMNQRELKNAFDAGTIQAGLITWNTPEEHAEWVEHFGSSNVINLYSIPISYIARPDLSIDFTPGGWPLLAS